MNCVWREGKAHCKNHRWRDWYLCLGHINAIRVNKVVLAEEEARKMERAPVTRKPSRDSGGLSVLEYFRERSHAQHA
jgi:hypothetical protein